MAEEKNFENKLKRYLASKGIYDISTPKQKKTVPQIGYYVKRWGGGIYTKAGLPDIQVVIRGHAFEVEVKASKGRPSEIQLRVLEEMATGGATTMIVYPKDYDEFCEIVDTLCEE